MMKTFVGCCQFGLPGKLISIKFSHISCCVGNLGKYRFYVLETVYTVVRHQHKSDVRVGRKQCERKV